MKAKRLTFSLFHFEWVKEPVDPDYRESDVAGTMTERLPEEVWEEARGQRRMGFAPNDTKRTID